MTDHERHVPVLVDMPLSIIGKLDGIAEKNGKSREEKAKDIILSYIKANEADINKK